MNAHATTAASDFVGGHASTDFRHPAPANGSRRVLTGQTELVLIRGLPGSGKTTMAKALASRGYEHFEADMFFELGAVYRFDASRIRQAHAWCQQMTHQALLSDRPTVVSNTFTRLAEMAPYLEMTANIRVIEANGRWGSIHGVPPETLQRMAERWEALPADFRPAHPRRRLSFLTR